MIPNHVNTPVMCKSDDKFSITTMFTISFPGGVGLSCFVIKLLWDFKMSKKSAKPISYGNREQNITFRVIRWNS